MNAFLLYSIIELVPYLLSVSSLTETNEYANFVKQHMLIYATFLISLHRISS